jgi:phosphatidate phosphatase APP1
VRQYTDRILATYIRAVVSDRRDDIARQIAAEWTKAGIPMLSIEDVEAAFQHAERAGVIKS